MGTFLTIVLFIGIFLLIVALLEVPFVNSLKKQLKQSYELLPLNTPINTIAPIFSWTFPEVIPQTSTKIRLGRKSQRITVQVPNCPECGKYLILRDGKHGKFYGCTGYPVCHYTRSYR